jgi:hypothetical protein
MRKQWQCDMEASFPHSSSAPQAIFSNKYTIISSNIHKNKQFIRSFISQREFVYFYMYLKMRCARGFCFGIRNGELAGRALAPAPAPAVSLDAVAVRAAMDRKTDLAAVAAAEDMTLGWVGTMRGFVVF